MPRSARIVFPGEPHHITHRGLNRMKIFLSKSDYEKYKELLICYCNQYHIKIWNYCLMENHIHLVCVPLYDSSLSKGIGKTHEKYSTYILQKYKLSIKNLWHGRFYSFPLDLFHYQYAARYVEQNPVRARMVKHAEDWAWSSANHHLGIRTDPLVQRSDMSEFSDDWLAVLRESLPEMEKVLRKHSQSGKPLSR